MRLRTFALSALVFPLTATAQTSGVLGAYQEPFSGTVIERAAWRKLPSTPQLSWASRDVHYEQRQVPSINMRQDTTVWAWRGERVGMQALVFSNKTVKALSLAVSEANNLKATANFVNYVKGDGKRGCGDNDMSSAVTYVADVIDNQPTKMLRSMSVTPVWVTVEVPRDIQPGQQEITVTVNDNTTNEAIGELRLKVNIVDRQLPEPQNYSFNTNFWQQPYSVARYYGVEKWSQAHYDALRPYLELLARCGQKSVTAILFYEPWGAQSIDKHDEMIRSTKKKDGTWAYDYTVFDHYVALCDSCGINGQINCFSMVPWDMNFRYYDEDGNQHETGKITTASAEYKEIWTNFLKAFADHLKEKGWFDKTYIAMDERGLGDMQNAYNLLQEAVPGMKMSLAGNYHSELYDKLQDYCVAWQQRFTDAQLASRQQKGWVTTTYTACPDLAPNLETYNDPADIAYLPLYCIANGFNGFLHWSWMQWVADPLTDSRGSLFPAGDYYCIYPGPRSSVRYERYIEGVQQAEKVKVLRQAWANNPAKLDSLETQLRKFYSGELTYTNSSAHLVNVLEAIVNGSPVPGMEPSTQYCSTSLKSANQATAIAQRWVSRATISGDAVDKQVEMTWNAPSNDGYVVATDTLTLHPGKDVSFSLTGSKQSDGLQWCRAGFFADWDADRNFGSREDELINMTGNANKENANVLNYAVSFTVPVNARAGETRLRVVYNDAWGDAPDPCGELMKGFCIDFPVIIAGETTAIHNIGKGCDIAWNNSSLQTDGRVNVDVYTLQGMLVDSARDVTAYSTAHYTPGTYIIKVADSEGQTTTRKFTK